MTRTPLAAFPQVEFRTALDTAEVSLPLLAAAVSLRKCGNTLGHPSFEISATFTLTFAAADFSDEEAAALASAADEALGSRLTPALLNIEAEELGVPIHFHRFRWDETAAPAADSSAGTLSVEFSFVGTAEKTEG